MTDPIQVLGELATFGRALTGALRRETVADAAADCLQRLFAARVAAVALTGDGPGWLDIAATRGEPPDALDEFVRGVHRDHHLVRREAPPALGIPIVAAHHVLGVVAVARATPFDRNDEAAIATVAAQAAIALQNTRLVEILAAGKDEWEQMVDAIRPGIAILDRAGTIRRANRAFAELTGTPITVVTGQPWLLLLPPAWAEVVQRLLAQPGGEPGEIRSDSRIFSAQAHRVENEPGTHVLVIEEVTETRRLQEQLIQSEKMSAIGQLIAGVAHELNNPLASVLGFADFLADAQALPSGLAEPVRVIQQEAQRAGGIVKNLLSFARRQDQERRPVDLAPVLERTVALLRNQLIGLKVEPRLEVEPRLPAVNGSPNQLQQVFLNVINNAAQAIATTGNPGTVTVRARRWRDGVAVDITDDGPGIPIELQQRVFEPFFTTKAAGEGTGLGLSICQGIVREHGGRITVTSAPGAGATFTIELPPGGAVDTPAPATTDPAAGGGARVLVIDDEPHILYYMRATLEAWGHSVETASDGLAGFDLATAGGFDLVITDVRMPRLSGREFYERLRADHPAVAARVVFATGDTVRDDTMAFLEGTGRPFLNKPFKLAELRSALDAALAQARRRPPGG